MALQALELFCGIGGFAAAVDGYDVRIVGAIDHNQAALDVYRLNFPDHPARQGNLERITAEELASYGADLWWLSPPCQPYSVRGNRRDLEDTRSRSLVRILDEVDRIPDNSLPVHLALENVAGFAESAARMRLLDLLLKRGYHVQERHLCPTKLGVPSRRPRYYLAASRSRLNPHGSQASQPIRPLKGYVNPRLSAELPDGLRVPADIIARFGNGFRILDAEDSDAYTTCFTSAYGKAIMHAGSYLRCGGGVRRFSPEEIAGLLHFPACFRFLEGMPLRKKWHLVGNSLSVVAVREVLCAFWGVVPGTCAYGAS